MNNTVKKALHGILFILGLASMIAGTIMREGGAVVIGLIVASVNFRQYQNIHP
jgi:hypothetical protein